MSKLEGKKREGLLKGDVGVPFNRPWIGEEEREALERALSAGHMGGNGVICNRLQERLAEWMGVRQVLLTASCTVALEMAMMLLLKPGDEVVMPSFSFVSTANAVLRAGGLPVFADIDPHTYNLDPEAAKRAITQRTRAILPVHYGGQACEMERLQELSDLHNLCVIEDAAQAFGSRYGGRYAGGLGLVGALSFHSTKNVVCGEGGAFITDDEEMARRAEMIWEKGTNRSAFLRSEVDKYTWCEVGGSFVLSDLLAAVLEAQVEKLEAIVAARRQRWERYEAELSDLESSGKVLLHKVEARDGFNYHLFAFRTLAVPRDKLLTELRQRGVEATFHFVPLHTSPFCQRHLPTQPPLKHTEEVASSLVRLPLYPGLEPGEQDRVVEAVHDVLKGA